MARPDLRPVDLLDEDPGAPGVVPGQLEKGLSDLYAIACPEFEVSCEDDAVDGGADDGALELVLVYEVLLH